MGQGIDLQNRQGVSPAQLRRLRILHESMAREFGAALSVLLRTTVKVGLSGLERLTYGQFVYNVATPACFYLLQADPLDNRPMLEVEPVILHPMIDRLLGGSGENDSPPTRPLTEIELCLAARIVRLFLQEYCQAWKNVIELKLEVLQAEDNPRLLRIMPAEELVLLVSYELFIGQQRGMLRFCWPFRAIERMGDQLLAEDPASINRPAASSLADVKVTLAETQITAAELADLHAGDIIATETPVDSPATVSISGIVQFRGKPGVYRGRKAVQLTEAVEGSTPAMP
jgi:flagellar motor switch protein FliM